MINGHQNVTQKSLFGMQQVISKSNTTLPNGFTQVSTIVNHITNSVLEKIYDFYECD